MARTIVIIGSGASLTKHQCDYVQRQRQANKCKIIALNRSYEMTEPNIIYAADRRWWLKHYKDTPDCIKLTQCKRTAKELGIDYVRHQHGHKGLSKNPGLLYGKNSGQQAINAAYHLKATKIILIGFDVQATGGRVHWHDDYTDSVDDFGNTEKAVNGPGDWNDWLKGFPAIAKDLEDAGIEVINCTIETALTCFKRQMLAEAFR